MARPYKVVYAIRKINDDEKGKGQWTKIGAAFPNKDGSLSVTLDFVPTDLGKTKIHIRDPHPKEEPSAPHGQA
jgi:hypothetical protein